MVDGLVWPCVVWILAALVAVQYAGRQEPSSPAPLAVSGVCSCDSELREMLQSRRDLEKVLGVALLLGAVAGILGLVVVLLCCALCGHLACCARLVSRGPVVRSGLEASPASGRPSGSPQRRGDPDLLSILAASEVRR